MPNNLNRLLSFVVAIAMYITAIPLTVCGMGTSSATYTDNGEYMTSVNDSINKL